MNTGCAVHSDTRNPRRVRSCVCFDFPHCCTKCWCTSSTRGAIPRSTAAPCIKLSQYLETDAYCLLSSMMKWFDSEQQCSGVEDGGSCEMFSFNLFGGR